MTDKLIEQKIKETELLLEKYSEELAKCPLGQLAYTYEGGKYHRYYQVSWKNGKRIRKRITSNQDLVRGLARKAYLEERIQQLEENTAVLRATLNKLHLGDEATLILDLQEKFPSLTTAELVTPIDGANQRSNQLERTCKAFAPNGISRASFKWADEDYRQNDKPFNNTIYTSRGLRVRSKNELLIAERLYTFDIPFRYDAVIDLGGDYISPDFSFKNNASRLGLWEHFGMMHSLDYQNRYHYKNDLYNEFGFYPWDNLFMSFSSENDINLAEIDDLIKHRLLPWMISSIPAVAVK